MITIKVDIRKNVSSTQVAFFTQSAYFDTGHLKYLYFVIILSLYLFIVVANVLLIVVICMNRSLHEPMYMFLCSLFVNELYGSTSLFPFLLVQILSDVHTVSVPLCFLQIYCLLFYGNLEYFTLGAMSYDRYVAICLPLQYNTRMTCRKVVKIIAIMWLYSAVNASVLISVIVPLQLCGNIINKVYCDIPAVTKLGCSDGTFIDIYGPIYIFVIFFPLIIFILFSYVKILKVCFSGSKQTRQKVVSTCTPHLISLLNFSFGAFFEIIQSRFDMSHESNIRVFLSLYWLMSPPFFNPVLYGLNMTKIRNICLSLVFGKSVTPG
ncbi:olfactory receptor 10A6-like [Pholidichthys leucotaenia]